MAISSFGKNLQAVMSRRGLSISDVAKRTGLHYVLVSGYLKNDRGGRNPSLESVLKLMDGIPCTFEELTGRSAKESSPDKVRKPSPEAQKIGEAIDRLAPDSPTRRAIETLLEQYIRGGSVTDSK